MSIANTKWLEDNKREHLNLPKLTPHESVVWARRIDAPVSIPLTDRRMLLDDIGVFEVAIGEEEKAIRKSNYFFRTIGRSGPLYSNVIFRPIHILIFP